MGWANTIRQECLADTGLLGRIRLGQLDEDAHKRLLAAIREGTAAMEGQAVVDRLVVACLFEVPYEIENTREHYERNGARGDLVMSMAEELRLAIHEFMWVGLDDQYK